MRRTRDRGTSAIDNEGQPASAAPLKLSYSQNFRARRLELSIPVHAYTMSQKRKLDQVAEIDSADASDASSASASKKPRAHAKKHKRPNATKDEGYGASASALKNRIRDLKRLLAHVENVPKHKMSAGARIERERELEACEHELAEKTMKAHESEHRKKMIGKYHQVRFFGTSAPSWFFPRPC